MPMRGGSSGSRRGRATTRTFSAGTSRRASSRIDAYLHVYLERDDLRQFDTELRLVKAFAHYTGDRPDEIRRQYARVHDDVLYEKVL